jgi:HPt (histidine-containing phosphotransfer) domain-containing protein
MVVEINSDLKDLIPEYMESLHKDINRIQGFIENTDLENLKKEFHSLKGHSASYGFDYISNLASAMEFFTSDKRIDLLQKSMSQLFTYISELEVVFVEK